MSTKYNKNYFQLFVSFFESATNHVTGIETKLNPARVRNKTRNIESDS